MIETTQSEKVKNRLHHHSRVLLTVFIYILWITAIIMFGIMILGIVKIAFGIYQECSNSDNTGLIKILEGLELIFVAPLSYLLILSLTKYISATKPEINPSLEIKKKYINHSSLEITNVKILTTSLFISILLLHSIRLILQKEMSYNLIIYVLSLIVILIVYYLMLDSVANKLRAKNQDS